MCSVEKMGLKKDLIYGGSRGGEGVCTTCEMGSSEKEKKNETRCKSFLSDAPPTKKNPGPALVIESFRFKNEDQYEFFRLVIVRMRTCP